MEAGVLIAAVHLAQVGAKPPVLTHRERRVTRVDDRPVVVPVLSNNNSNKNNDGDDDDGHTDADDTKILMTIILLIIRI